MEEQTRLIIKKRELEQLIMSNQEQARSFNQLSGLTSAFADHPADLAAHMQVLNIELEKINEALEQNNPEPMP